MQLEAIDYFWGMYPSAAKADLRKATRHHRFVSPDIPQALQEAFERERIDELAGDFGRAGVGSPTQVDCLTYMIAGEERHVRVINRAIMMFASDDEELKRLHRFFGSIENVAGRRAE